MSDKPAGILLAKVEITRYLTDDDVIDYVVVENGEGADLGLAEALGMTTLAQHTLVETYTRRNAD